jgi:hypothetical protein
MLPINRTPDARELNRFRWIFLPLFVLALGAVAWWQFAATITAILIWTAGGFLAGLALSSAAHARTLFVGLQTITYPIGLIVSFVALAILFFGVFTPIALVMRAMGRDPLRLRARNDASHWLPYTQDDDAERAFRQY